MADEKADANPTQGETQPEHKDDTQPKHEGSVPHQESTATLGSAPADTTSNAILQVSDSADQNGSHDVAQDASAQLLQATADAGGMNEDEAAADHSALAGRNDDDVPQTSAEHLPTSFQDTAEQQDSAPQSTQDFAMQDAVADPNGAAMTAASAHAYASNGLQVLQAASDAAQAIQYAHTHHQSAPQEPTTQAATQEHQQHQIQQSHDNEQHVHQQQLPPQEEQQPQQPQQQQQQQQQQQSQQEQQQQQSQVPGGVSDATSARAIATAAAAAQAATMAGVISGHPFAPVAPVTRDPTVNPKLTRLRRACDMCSSRKVKCDESGPPCKPCQDLNVECTFTRELKRRGPPNKHAEAAKAAKRARLEPGPGPGPSPGVPGVPGQPYVQNPNAPSSSPHNAAQTLVSIAEGPARLDAEAIAPMPVLELLVDDFFTYIHPLTPFPHEPTFRDAFANRQDRTNLEFLGLLASMVGALVSSFPRSARQHLKAQHSTHLFPRAIVLIEKCRDIALDTRGPRWAAKQPKTLDDAATSYFLGLAASYTMQVNNYRYFTSECLTLIRELGFHRPKNPGELPTFGNDNQSPDPLPFHHIKDQIGKRIFWCLLLGVRSFSQLGASHSDLVIPPMTPALPYPALPENVDDRSIMANEIQFTESDGVTLMTGFRFVADIYTTMNGIVSVELVYGMSTLTWQDQRTMLRDALIAAKDIVDRLPPELQLHASHDQSNGGPGVLDDPNLQYVPPAYPNAQQPANDVRNVIKGNAQRRRQLQYEIQKANIFISQLATRSYFVELYFNLRDNHLADPNKPMFDESTDEGRIAKANEDAEAERVFELMTAERELIVQNLLYVLGSISQRSLEPNGGSMINKVRQVASTLLNDAPERKGPLAVKAEESLGKLIDVLIKLERVGPGAGAGAGASAGAGAEGGAESNNMTAQDEEEELRLWSNLRDYQQRFAAHGGFTASI